MSNVIQLFADNNVIDFATKQPIPQVRANNVDNSLAARRAKRSGSADISNSNVIIFYPQDCA
jgi:hypothetical protein